MGIIDWLDELLPRTLRYLRAAPDETGEDRSLVAAINEELSRFVSLHDVGDDPEALVRTARIERRQVLGGG